MTKGSTDVVADLGTGIMAFMLVLAFPAALLAMVWILGRLEDWMLRPYERAVEIHRLLAHEEEVDVVERAVTDMMADVTDSPRAREARSSLKQSVG